MRGLSTLAATLACLLVTGAAFGESSGWTLGGVRSTDSRLDISKGNVPNTDYIAKFGENPDIDDATFETIWDVGGIYVPPTVARLHDIASTLAGDAGTVLSSGTATGGSTTTLVDTGATFVTDTVSVGDALLNDSNITIGGITAVTETTLTIAGAIRSPNSGLAAAANATGDSYRVVTDASTGVSILHISGLDANFLEQEEFVVLNGTNDVSTASTYIRQFRARVFSSVATDAAGTITSTAATDGTISLQVDNGNNQTLMTIYTCPVDKTCYIVKWWGSMARLVASAVSVIHLTAGTLDGIGYIVQTRAINTSGGAAFSYDYSIPIPIPGGADIWVEANSTANDVGVSAGFDIIVEDN